MKKCPNCGSIYNDDMTQCPTCNAALEDYVPEQPKPKATVWDILNKYIKVVLPAVLIIGFILGFGIKSCTGIKEANYNQILQENEDLKKEKKALKGQKDKIEKEYTEYKEKMQPYEEQQASDTKSERNQKAAEDADSRAEAQANAIKEAEEKAAQEDAIRESISEMQQENNDGTQAVESGEISKDYKPSGNEPDWIEIVSYCEVEMPEVIGFDASISLDENDTKIVRTGLRYKIETDRLKLKSDKSYHKAVFILEFEDDSYERYKIDTAEVDGVSYR